jgi:hypothetical protein
MNCVAGCGRNTARSRIVTTGAPGTASAVSGRAGFGVASETHHRTHRTTHGGLASPAPARVPTPAPVPAPTPKARSPAPAEPELPQLAAPLSPSPDAPDPDDPGLPGPEAPDPEPPPVVRLPSITAAPSPTCPRTWGHPPSSAEALSQAPEAIAGCAGSKTSKREPIRIARIIDRKSHRHPRQTRVRESKPRRELR